MIRHIARLIVPVGLVLATGAIPVLAQDLPPTPQPVSSAAPPATPVAAPPVTAAPAAQPITVVPPPVVYATDQPPGPPCPELLPATPFYVGADVGILRPSVHIDFTGRGNVDLDWAVAPRAYVGYRFGDGGGVRLAYRNLTSQGGTTIELDDGSPQEVSLRMNVNWLDLDYVSREYAPGNVWRLQWWAGGRVVNRFMDARAEDETGVLHNSTTFWGGGPHAGLSSRWQLCGGLSFFTDLDAALAFGSSRAHLSLALGDPAVGTFSEAPDRSETEADITLLVGLSWCKSWQNRYVKLAGGLQLEGWAVSGNNDTGDFPFKNVGSVGPFFRCEFGF